jgi:Plasmid pRiA4b ORF-3-like protein
MAKTGTHILRVALRHEPATYRDIEVESGKSLEHLAEAIVQAFGFDFDHAFGFYSGRTDRTLMSADPKYELFADMGEGSSAKSVRKSRIAEAFPRTGSVLTFLFDYGDEWLFTVKVTGFGEKASKERYPKVLASKGAAPEQYPDPDDGDEDG